MNQNFHAVAQRTLQFLHRRFGFALWMLTRAEGKDWIVLAAEDHGYGVNEGKVFRWEDSFCSRMVKGLGPRISPDAQEIKSYVAAPINSQLKIGAYIGIPLLRTDGSLFGTLCAVDPSPQPPRIVEEQELLELLANLLNRLLNAEISGEETARRAERIEMEMNRDKLTSLYNRRGWDSLLAKEEERCRRYGHPACVIFVDLDELKTINDTKGHLAGDALLVSAARAIMQSARATDVAARFGGDEFAILAIECDAAAAAVLVERLRAQLETQGVKASIGVARRQPDKSLFDALTEADAAMYAEKNVRKEQGSA